MPTLMYSLDVIDQTTLRSNMNQRVTLHTARQRPEAYYSDKRSEPCSKP